ncbi:hypothetical protein BDA99DRAFT_445010 [Phascolomyces articulosus]|uniref:Arylesterase n=1 Tax=Phascolomyces articulosus TaxID=60185 RepID=A0AAD5P9Y3_9FUNG|nr:hypothetical protein BDA99DRAFT_445010 [Phascolomyces articulosus]
MKIQTGPDEFRNCEDIVLSPTEPGIAYTACDPARDYKNMVMDIHHPMTHPQPGYIWRVDYIQKTATQLFTLEGDTDFHPLGLALVNPSLLMVINLRHQNPASIELFSLTEAQHIRTITHPKIYAPNSIHILKGRSAPDGTPSFFFTNDHYFLKGTKKKLENFGRLPLASVMFFDAFSHTVYPVARGFLFANGLAGDHKHVLFVAETNRMAINRYDIIVEDNIQLQFVNKVTMPMAVDNIHYDAQTGDVLVAGHPFVLDLLKFLHYNDGATIKNSKKPASQVMVWHTNTNQVEDIFVDDGTLYPTTSSAVIDHESRSLVISGLYAQGILVCDQ